MRFTFFPRKLTKSHSSQGFTIVELLIVIVIIGILSALVIVAYNGIQERARVQQQVTALTQYAKVFSQYTTEKGSLPYQPTADGQVACIYPTTNCWGSWDVARTTDLQSNIQTYNNSTFSWNTIVLINQSVGYSSSSYNGIYFLVQFPASIACPSISGLNYLNTSGGNPTTCRYGLVVTP